MQAGQILRPAPSAALSAGRLGGGGKRGGRPALWRVSRPSLSLFLGVFLCLLLPVVSLLLAGSGGWSVVLVVSLAGLLPGLPGLSGRPRWRRLLPVWPVLLPLPPVFGRLVRLLGAWLLYVARRKKSPAR